MVAGAPSSDDRAARGFTLIELLVVIAIIALLVSMLLPSLKRAKEMAYAAQCATQLHALGQGFHQYAGEFDSYLTGPQAFNPLDAPWPGKGSDWHFYVTYMGGPENYRGATTAEDSLVKPHAMRIFHCPTGPVTKAGMGAWQVDNISSYSQSNLFCESWRPLPRRAHLDNFGNPAQAGWLAEMGAVPDGSFWDSTHQGLTRRHNDGGNILFVDGHVDDVGHDEFVLYHEDIRKGIGY